MRAWVILPSLLAVFSILILTCLLLKTKFLFQNVPTPSAAFDTAELEEELGLVYFKKLSGIIHIHARSCLSNSRSTREERTWIDWYLKWRVGSQIERVKSPEFTSSFSQQFRQCFIHKNWICQRISLCFKGKLKKS
jgi:hypothetical protein